MVRSVRDSVRRVFVEFSAPLEGCVEWMYQDVKGLVTVGIGNLIDPIQYAMQLPFVDRATGQPAGRDVIAAEWLRIKNDPTLATLGHRAAERVTRLRMTDDGIASLVARKLEQHDRHMLLRWPDMEEWPACAQLAAHSIAWACGPAFAFPRLSEHMRRQDWLAAETECHLNERGNPGLAPRNAANKMLLRNAARVRDYRLDPDLIEWRSLLSVADAPTLSELPNPASYPTIHVDPSAILRPESWLDADPDDS